MLAGEDGVPAGEDEVPADEGEGRTDEGGDQEDSSRGHADGTVHRVRNNHRGSHSRSHGRDHDDHIHERSLKDRRRSSRRHLPQPSEELELHPSSWRLHLQKCWRTRVPCKAGKWIDVPWLMWRRAWLTMLQVDENRWSSQWGDSRRLSTVW